MIRLTNSALLLCWAMLAWMCPTNLVRAQKTNTIEVSQDFQKGKLYRYNVQKGKEDSRKPGSGLHKSSTEITLKVVSEDKRTQLKKCSWKYGTTTILGVDPQYINKDVQKLLNVNEGLELEFYVNTSGQIEEFINFEECKKFGLNTLERTFEIDNNATSKEQKEQVIEALLPTVANPQVFIGAYFPELQLMFGMNTVVVYTDSISYDEAFLPNPLGGPDFPAQYATTVDAIEGNFATISVSQTIADEDLNAILLQTFAEMMKKSSQKVTEEDMPSINLTITTTYRYDYLNYSMKEVVSENVSNIGDVKQVRTIRVVLEE